ncbi:uncharacterized protein GGS22DRAFT_196386 [Annulohypoxylon maeteangense]|uniref:uncharacterized protein n=1 Tax=Annulohypoxylon maeteangense TaxID=1927788 RepID=UPI002008222D|nr:uncharacterized protein GGS22DRAFT_196386 [Annulohypoxylon maeteangense]KAI0881832.1 hypothetical protein GGS22DRAFT_196386 [Annulohypoxylon maeteangense]
MAAPGNGNAPAHGFSLPDADFDAFNNQAIQDYYKKKANEDILTGPTEVEDDIETEARQVVKNWEKVVGRQATTEERERMTAKIHRIRAGAWLERTKKNLVGETTVPIAVFNRFVAQNEGSVAYVARRMCDMAEEREQAAEEIRNLRDANGRLAMDAAKRCDEEKAKLTSENDELAKKIAELEENNERLRDDLDDAINQPPIDDKAKDEIVRLESEINDLLREHTYRDAKIKTLETELRESRKRENAARDEIRMQDRQITELENKNDSQGRDIRDKDHEISQLKLSKSNPEKTDTAAIIKGLRKAKRDHEEISKEVQALIDDWMASIADQNNLREYHICVEDLKKDLQFLRGKVLEFNEGLGNTTTPETNALEVLKSLTEELNKQPKQQMRTRLWSLKLVTDLSLAETRLKTEQLRTDTLRMQLEMKKSDEQLSAETKMQYGIYNQEEIEREVDSRTQMYRNHRLEILDNIFGAAEDLKVVAIRCTHVPTRTQINDICKKYLTPESLPKPKLQPPRMPRN